MVKKMAVIGLMLAGLAGVSNAASGKVDLKGTDSSSAIHGTVTLTDGFDGVKLSLQVAGLPPGLHGFHVHEFGSCDDKGQAAGGHYNPRGTLHGQVMKDGSMKAHSGDMGNIKADAKGNASFEAMLPGVALTGKDASLGGRAVIIHENADDFSQPVGNAGGRIACGPIVLVADPASAKK